jgi:hypothetical protein
LFARNHLGVWDHRTLDGVVNGLVRSEEAGNPVVLVGLTEGFLAVNVYVGDLQQAAVSGRNLLQPTLGWTRNGIAVAVDGRCVQLRPLHDGTLARGQEFPYSSGQPRQILPTPVPDEVVFVAAQTVTRIRVGC